MADFLDLKKAFRSIFSKPIAFHPTLAKLSGGAVSGLMLSQACYWSDTLPEERGGWFFKTRDQWQEETQLTRWEQERARKDLCRKKYLQEERRGVPAKLWYRVNYEKIWQDLSQTSWWDGLQPVGGVSSNKTEGCPPTLSLTENTSESTSEKNKTVATLPPWVPVREWGEFCEMRKRFRNVPFTEAAKRRTLDDLWKLSEKGENLAVVLATSVQRGWRGVFSVEEKTNGKHKSFEQQKRQREEKALSEVRASADGILQQMEGDISDTRSLKSPDGTLFGGTRKLLGK